MDDPRNAYKKAIQYWFNDGINELLLAGIALLLAVYFGAVEIFPQNSFIDVLLEASFILFVFAGAYGLNKIARYLKERITYPRGGYIVFKQQKRLPRWIAAILGMLIGGLVGAVITAFLSKIDDYTRWLPAISGIFISTILLVIAIRMNLYRIFLESFLALALSVVITWLHIDGNAGLSVYYALLGFVLFVIAGITLWQFIQTHPLPSEETDE